MKRVNSVSHDANRRSDKSKLNLFIVLILAAFFTIAIVVGSFHQPNVTGNVISVFDGNPVSAVRGGLWNDQATWSTNRVPTASDSVIIDGNKVIEVNTNAVAKDIRVTNGATLKASRTLSSRLDVSGSISVTSSSTIDYGRQSDPIPAGIQAIIGFNVADDRLFNGNAVPDNFISGMPDYQPEDTGLWVVGTGSSGYFYGASKNFVWTKLSGDARSGTTVLNISGVVTGWMPGDTVLISSTSKDADESETGVIASVGGNRVTLRDPLKYTHEGSVYAYNATTNIPMQGEVALLTQNVRVQSNLVREGDTHHRAHTVWMHGATGGIGYTEFRDLGTRGKMGRYSIHLHKNGDAGSTFVIQGASIWQSTTDPGNKWVVIHTSNGVTVKDSAGYLAQGRGYYLEDGDEINVVLKNNLGVKAVSPEELPNTVVPLSFQPKDGSAAFWVREGNTVENNVASGGKGAAGIWITPNRNAAASTTSFKNNEVHGSITGIFVTGDDKTISPIQNSLVWRNGDAYHLDEKVSTNIQGSNLVGNGKSQFSGSLRTSSNILVVKEREPYIVIEPKDNPAWTNVRNYVLNYVFYDGLNTYNRQRSITLNEGYNEIRITETSKYGQIVNSMYPVRLDTRAPQIKIDSALNPSSVNDADYILRYTVDDGNYTVNKYKEFVLRSGSNTLSITDSDFSGNNNTATYTVNLDQRPNTAPILSNLQSTYSISEGDILRIPIGTDDTENDVVNYSLIYLVNGVSRVLPANVFYSPVGISEIERNTRYGDHTVYLQPNVFTFQPAFNQSGTYTFKLKATDEKGALTEKQFVINVADYNSEAPIITLKRYYNYQYDSVTPPIAEGETVYGSISNTVDKSYGANRIVFLLYVKDLQGDNFTAEVVGGPTRSVFSNDTSVCRAPGCMYLKFGGDQLGPVNTKVKVTDSKGNSRELNIVLNLGPGTGIPKQDASNGAPISFNVGRQRPLINDYDTLSGTINLIPYAGKPDNFNSSNGYPLSFRFLIDGQPVSPVITRAQTSYAFNTASVADGFHILGVAIVDAEDVAGYPLTNRKIFINNQPGGVDKAQLMPYAVNLDGTGVQQEDDMHAMTDFIPYSGQREHSPSHPYPYNFSAPVYTRGNQTISLGSDNWFTEVLTGPGNLGYMGDDFSEILVKNANGDVGVAQISPTNSLGFFDGGRLDSGVSPVTQYVADPENPGFYGIDRFGRLFRISPEGTVTTIAGKVLPNDRIPTMGTVDEVNAQRIVVGNFENNVFFNSPNDLYFDSRDHKIIYVADMGNHRIAKVDLHGTVPNITTLAGRPGVRGYVDGPVRNALFSSPSSIVSDWRDNSLYVADRDNRAIRRIYPNGTVTTTWNPSLTYSGQIVLSNNIWPNLMSGITKDTRNITTGAFIADHNGYYDKNGTVFKFDIRNPTSVKMNSLGELIIADGCIGGVWKLNSEARTLDLLFSDTFFARGIQNVTCALGQLDNSWADVDFRGTTGPKDDILFSSDGQSGLFPGTYNINWFRISTDGVRSGSLFFDGTFGSNSRGPKGYGDGQINAIFAPGGRFPHSLAADDEEARIILSSNAVLGATIARLKTPEDPRNNNMDLFRNEAANAQLESGAQIGPTPMGQEYRPSFASIHGSLGLTKTGVIPNYDDLALLPDDKLTDYIRSGLGGTVQRPEFVGKDLTDFIWFIRRQSLYGNTHQTTPAPRGTDTKKPEIRSIQVNVLSSTSAKISWKTDEPTFGFINYGSNSAQGLITTDSWNGKDHQIVLTDLPNGREIYYTIYSADMNSNYESTVTSTFELGTSATCAAQSGTVCTASQTCSGNFVSARDADLCCVGSCITACVPNWQPGAWSTCTNGQQTRTVTDTACGLPPTNQTQSCGGTTTCTALYSEWSTCTNGQQTRTVTGSNPAGCTPAATSIRLTQACDPEAITREAESFNSGNNASTYNWTKVTGSYSDGAAMVTTPNKGSGFASSPATVVNAPKLSYNINFPSNGTYYIWFKGKGGGTDDSVSYGIDGIFYNDVDFLGTNSWNSYNLDGQKLTMNVSTPGAHTVNVWMREDGSTFDAFLLTKNVNFVPTN